MSSRPACRAATSRARRTLALLVNAAYADATVRQLSTSPEHQVEVGNRMLQYNTTNRLVKNPDWDIGLQKTGYISEAGQCLVMQTKIAGRKLIMVFLDSAGKLSRIGDAERVRRWVEATHGHPACRRQHLGGDVDWLSSRRRPRRGRSAQAAARCASAL